jgi:hypothetical protein
MKKKKKSKSAFIRAQSMTKSTQDVIADAALAGLEINANYVHSIRSEMRRATKASIHVAAPALRAEDAAIIPPPRAVTVLLAAASELGLSQAINILTNERQRVRGILG